MNSHQRQPRVAVVERFRLVAHTLANVLSSCCDPVPVVAQSLYSTEEVRRSILQRRSDIVLLGADLGAVVDVVRLAEELVAEGRTVIALAPDAETRAHLLWAGARSAPRADAGVGAVRAAIRAALEQVPPERPPLAVGPASPRRALLRRLGSLTRREVDVLAQLVRGRSAAEIARHHVVSEMTVRTQIKSILRKLEVESQLAAVAVARQAGWEPPFVEAA